MLSFSDVRASGCSHGSPQYGTCIRFAVGATSELWHGRHTMPSFFKSDILILPSGRPRCFEQNRFSWLEAEENGVMGE
ncbi:hypothetical protein C2S51_027624 [Perilla frutescens var. frutescens]|nr:hypothetical protein C2S51_027624 [Perilla frutescens var. frutescens]